MKTNLIKSVLSVVIALSVVGIASAQSGFDLMPPPELGSSVRFACLEMDGEEDVRVVLSTTSIKPRKIDAVVDKKENELVEEIKSEDLELTTESRSGSDGVVKMGYVVQIPYTEKLTNADGSTETKQRVRTETRTRMITISDIDNKKKVRYQVRIPEMVSVTETTSEGMEEATALRFKAKKQSKIIGKDEQMVKLTRAVRPRKRLADLQFSTLDGTKVSTADVAERIGSGEIVRLPVVLLRKGATLPEYFGLILKPDTLVVTDPFVE